MTTHETLEEARQAATEHGNKIRSIIEIEHETHGRCYIKALGTLAALQDAIRRSGKGLPGVTNLVAEHPVKAPEQVEAERVAYLRDNTRCERCGVKVDGNTAYSQQEWSRFGGRRIKVVAHYCEPCTAILQALATSGESYAKSDW